LPCARAYANVHPHSPSKFQVQYGTPCRNTRVRSKSTKSAHAHVSPPRQDRHLPRGETPARVHQLSECLLSVPSRTMRARAPLPAVPSPRVTAQERERGPPGRRREPPWTCPSGLVPMPRVHAAQTRPHPSMLPKGSATATAMRGSLRTVPSAAAPTAPARTAPARAHALRAARVWRMKPWTVATSYGCEATRVGRVWREARGSGTVSCAA